MTNSIPRIAVTAGEPAGIGPDLVLALAGAAWPAQLVAIGDIEMLRRRARTLSISVDVGPVDLDAPIIPHIPGTLWVKHVPLSTPEEAGKLNSANAEYVLATLRDACGGCMKKDYAAMLTGPVHKGVINDAGSTFTGHTEFLAEFSGAPMPVMLLTADRLRVALVTTHLALRDVPAAIDAPRIRQIATILHEDLARLFGIAEPRILVLGLNPHAGESGHLGTEERDIITPVIDELRAAGLHIDGPLPADTAFTEPQLARADAVLAMYHDQGLPVLKNRGFGRAVNVTLGLPIIRTSVDHGTALELAGTGRADAGSMRAALELAVDLAGRQAK